AGGRRDEHRADLAGRRRAREPPAQRVSPVLTGCRGVVTPERRGTGCTSMNTRRKPAPIGGTCASVPAMDARDDEALGLEEVALVEPSPEVRTRLLASVGAGRFSGFAGPIAAMFDVTMDRAHELLGLIERSASWKSQIPGVEIIAFAGGPKLTNA